QGIHFGVIVTRAFMEPGNELRSVTMRSVLTVIVGFGSVSIAAFTARATSGLRVRLHGASVYVLWGLFGVFFFLHASGRTGTPAEPAAAAMLVVMFAALAWRMVAPLAIRREAAASASSGA